MTQSSALSLPVAIDTLRADRLTDDDRRGLTPLFWSNINPYGTGVLVEDALDEDGVDVHQGGLQQV